MSYTTDTIDERVKEILKYGGIGVLPTDTIYGISCLAFDKEAVERVHDLKRRDRNKPLIILVSHREDMKRLGVTDREAELAFDRWPAPLTVIMRAVEAREHLHKGTKYLALRMPDNKQLLKLIEEVGPIVSTSPNISGESPIDNIPEIKETFGDKLDFYVDTGVLKGRPSTLAEIHEGSFIILRQGSYRIS